jgi:hypothetical protein
LEKTGSGISGGDYNSSACFKACAQSSSQKARRFSGHLDTTLHQVHLVDEKMETQSKKQHQYEATKFLEGNDSTLFTRPRIRHRPDTNKAEDLGEDSPYVLMLSVPREGEGNEFGVCASLFLELLEACGRHLGRLQRQAVGIEEGQCVHVTASGNIRVTDQVSTGAGIGTLR